MAEEYKAIDAYKADGPGQVSFKVGDTIHVLDKLEDGKFKNINKIDSSNYENRSVTLAVVNFLSVR